MRPRVVVTALLGVVPVVLIVQWSDLLVGGTMMAGPFPPLAACLMWSALLCIQFSIKRSGRKPPFTNPEMLALLAVWLGANTVAGRGLLHPLLASLAGPVYYAKSGAMAKAAPRDIPDWLAVTNPAAARDFFEGHGVTTPWAVWIHPLAVWGIFFGFFLLANVCLCVLFERVWVRHEKLAFPLVALPLEALSDGSPRSRAALKRAVMIGMLFPAILHVPGVAHAYLPVVPCIPFWNDMSGAVTNPPWTALKPLYLNIYPLLIGLTFLAPTDVTLSVWFFLLLNKLEMVTAGAAGWTDGATGGGMTAAPPYLEEQSAGAYLALFAVLVWNARTHLGRIAMAAIRPILRIAGARFAVAKEHESAYRPYAAPALGFVVGFVGMMVWCSKTGMPVWFATLFFGFYMAVALVLSRLMAEGGVSWILAPILPDKLIFGLFGSGALTNSSIARLSLHVQHLRDTRQMIGPAVMQTGKLRSEAGISGRSFYPLLLACIGLALIVGVVTALPVLYAHGALSLTPNSDGLMMSANVVPLTGVNQAAARLSHPVRPSSGGIVGLAIGIGATFALSALRMRFDWWPLHPLGYALTGTLQLGYANKMLFSIFVGWFLKTIVLRFGGVSGYRQLRGAALGLVLGDLAMGALLKLLDAVLGPSGYAIF